MSNITFPEVLSKAMVVTVKSWTGHDDGCDKNDGLNRSRGDGAKFGLEISNTGV